jgi:hypothetical protein
MYLTPLTNTQTVNSAPNKTTVPLQIASAQAITSSFWPQLKKHSLVRTEHYISLSWYSFTTQRSAQETTIPITETDNKGHGHWHGRDAHLTSQAFRKKIKEQNIPNINTQN